MLPHRVLWGSIFLCGLEKVLFLSRFGLQFFVRCGIMMEM